MKRSFGLVLALAVCPAAMWAASSVEALVAEVRGAFEAKDAAKLEALTYAEGLSEAERARQGAALAENVAEGSLDKVEATPVAEDERLTRIYQGRRYTLTAEPAGQVSVSQRIGQGTTKSGLFYGMVNGEYRLLAFKSEDLGWKGPADRQISFTISSFQQASLRKIRARYNASGVAVEGASKYASWGFLGQRLDEVSFESEDEAFEGEIVVSEAGREVARSEKFRGKGPFVYRPRPTTP